MGDVKQFDTMGLDAAGSLKAWRQQLTRFSHRHEISVVSDRMSGRLCKRSFAAADISSLVQTEGQRVTRTKTAARQDQVERFCFVFPISGSLECRQQRSEYQVNPGEFCIVNSQEGYEVNLSPHAEVVTLTLPSDLVRLRVRGIDDLRGTRGVGDPVMVSTLRKLIRNALDVVPAVGAERVQDLCLELADMMIVPSARRSIASGGYAEAVAVRTFEKARRHINSSFADRRLSVAATAMACGVSVRLLQSAFARMETTFGDELLKVRLAAASRLLRSDAAAVRSIVDIALESGFVSHSHFSTRYRERYGRTPRDERSLRRELN